MRSGKCRESKLTEVGRGKGRSYSRRKRELEWRSKSTYRAGCNINSLRIRLRAAGYVHNHWLSSWPAPASTLALGPSAKLKSAASSSASAAGARVVTLPRDDCHSVSNESSSLSYVRPSTEDPEAYPPSACVRSRSVCS